VPDVASYFGSDVIPVLETQRGHYENLMSISTINFIGPLVLAVGIIVIIYGLAHAAPRIASGAGHEQGHQTLTESGDVAALVDPEKDTR